jgi:ADP-L-glycero-D-manno-heptose 6-epimerase
MILITGAAGFIGSYMAGYLDRLGRDDLILCDDFSRADKQLNWNDKGFSSAIHREVLFDWLALHGSQVSCVIHLGARTDTTEQDMAIFDRLNYHYSKSLWLFCAEQQIPFFYASSAATYGDGALGYDDRLAPEQLKPLNPYGQSKNNFDAWALAQTERPLRWAGFKFFNVYGPNEYHKGRMASVVFHSYNQIQAQGMVKLFRSHRPDFADGMQSRDFIYVNDIAQVIHSFIETDIPDGIYNLGTGIARPFLDLSTAVFQALNLRPNIQFIDTPLDIRDSYQYFTQADMSKLREAGYTQPFTSLEAGVTEYVQQFLRQGYRY